MDRPSSPPDLHARSENASRGRTPEKNARQDGVPSASGGRPSGALIAGAVAGPLLVGSCVVQGLVREGFSFVLHPPSALALGPAGLVQQSTFVASGLLLAYGGRGLRGHGVGRWVPRLMVVLGAGLAAAGVFPMDPAFGFPPGTPPGAGASVSWHAAIHGVLFPVGFLALVGAAVVAARRHARDGRPLMCGTTCAAAGSSLLLSLWPSLTGDPGGRFLPMWFGVAIGYAWTSLLFADVIRRGRSTGVG